MESTLETIHMMVQKKISLDASIESYREYLKAPSGGISYGKDFNDDAHIHHLTCSYIIQTNALVDIRRRLNLILKPSETSVTRTAVENLTDLIARKMVSLREAQIAIKAIMRNMLTIEEFIYVMANRPSEQIPTSQQDYFRKICEPILMELRVFVWRCSHPELAYDYGFAQEFLELQQYFGERPSQAKKMPPNMC